MTTVIKCFGRVMVWSALVVLLFLSCPTADGAGRWITHMLIQDSHPGAVSMPVDEFQIPETEGHWVWLVWYDYSRGEWAYNLQNPYYFSNGTIEYRVPQLDHWYYLYIYDTVTGTYY